MLRGRHLMKLLLLLGAKGSLCAVTVIPYLNSSSSTVTISSPATPTTTLTPSTVTSGPNTMVNEDGQTIYLNTCSYYNTEESRYEWNSPSCTMYAGTVDLVYWPTNDNYSYPATYYQASLDYTFTSPSVYMVVNTLYAENKCGFLGPSTSREVFGFDLTQVSTLVPYFDTTATTRRSTRQLYLSDLGKNCAATYDYSSLLTNTHPIKDDDTRCNPNLVVPIQLKRWGYPYWFHCGVHKNKFGLLDPPYAIPEVDGLIGATTSSDAVQTTEAASAGSASTQAVATATTTIPDPATSSVGSIGEASSISEAITRGMGATDVAAASTASADPTSSTSSGAGGQSGNDSGDDSGAGNHSSSGNDSGSGDDSGSGNDSGSEDGGSGGNSGSADDSGSGDDGSSGNGDSGDSSSTTGDSGSGDGGSGGGGSGNDYGSGDDSGSDSSSSGGDRSTDNDSSGSGSGFMTSATRTVSLGSSGIKVADGSTTFTTQASKATVSGAVVAMYDGTTLTLGGSDATVVDQVAATPAMSDLSIVTQVVSLGSDDHLEIVEYNQGTTATYTLQASIETVSGVEIAEYDGTTLTRNAAAATIVDTITAPAVSGSSGTYTEVASLGTDGVEVVRYGDSTTASYTVDVATVVAGGSTVAVYDGETLTLGGAASTETESVGSGNSTTTAATVPPSASATRAVHGYLCLVVALVCAMLVV